MTENNLHQGAEGPLFGHARENRRKKTAAEEKLWQHLRNRKLQGAKFRRQHPLAGFVADFYCHEAKLVLEVDGGYHAEEGQKDYDAGRSLELEELGLSVLRFRNEEVLQGMEGVLVRIAGKLGRKNISS